MSILVIRHRTKNQNPIDGSQREVWIQLKPFFDISRSNRFIETRFTVTDISRIIGQSDNRTIALSKVSFFCANVCVRKSVEECVEDI